MDSKKSVMIFQIIVPFVLYLCVLISGLIIAISMGLAKGCFDGNCPLYTEFHQNFDQYQKSYDFGSESSCNYTIYFPVLGLVLYPIVMCILYIYVFVCECLGKDKAIEVIRTIPVMCLNCAIFLLLLVTACMISTGRTVMCSSFYAHSGQPSCYAIESKKDWPVSRYETNRLVRHIVSAEATAWICHIWLILLILPTVLDLWRKFRKPSPA